jgi:hypothetical protein
VLRLIITDELCTSLFQQSGPNCDRTILLLVGLETKAFLFFWREVALKGSAVRGHGMTLAARGFPRGQARNDPTLTA